MPVVLNPDYVVYRGSSCSVCAVIFSCTGVKIKDLITDAKAGTFGFERQIDDIIDIKCQWFQRVSFLVEESVDLLLVLVNEFMWGVCRVIWLS